LVLRFECYHCIHCCFFSTPVDYPVVLGEEVSRLKELASKRGILLNFMQVTSDFYLWIIDGFCPFYDLRRRRCTIHELKPISCKMFPLLINIKTGEVSVSSACDWVAGHIDELMNIGDNISNVFQNEFRVALNLFRRIKA